MRIKELIVYRNLKQDKLLSDMAWLMEHFDDDYYNLEDREDLFFECIHTMLDKAAHHGFYGNLWHCYIANLLVNDENAYSLGSEIRGEQQGTLNEVALHDFAIIKELTDYDFTQMGDKFGQDTLAYIRNFEGNHKKSHVEEDAQIFLYRFEELGDDEVNLETIEDDDEFELVSDYFDEMLDEQEFNELFNGAE